MYILDTNILIEVLSGNKDLADKLKRLGSTPAITVFNYAETLFGVCDREDYAGVKEVLDSEFIVHDATKESAIIFASLKANQSRIGKPLPDFDLMIASVTIENKKILVTRDRHFSLIPDLNPLII
jgi:tRNA(fMet)-specific endonuclease VapC